MCIRDSLGYCTREAMNVPSGERYELCRSVHAEMNAIISAARRDTLGATLYLAGREAKTGELLHDATSCSMCRRLIINAGIQLSLIHILTGPLRLLIAPGQAAQKQIDGVLRPDTQHGMSRPRHTQVGDKAGALDVYKRQEQDGAH